MKTTLDRNVQYALDNGLVITAVKPREKQYIDAEPLSTWAEWEQAKHQHGADINAAIHLNPSNLCVFDFDTPTGFQGFARLHTWPETAMVRTARGVHIFFRRPNERDVMTAGRIELPGLGHVGEYLCGNHLHHYTLLPGSTHPTGYRYHWLRPPHDGIALLPGDLLRYVAMDTGTIYDDEGRDDDEYEWT